MRWHEGMIVWSTVLDVDNNLSGSKLFVHFSIHIVITIHFRLIFQPMLDVCVFSGRKCT